MKIENKKVYLKSDEVSNVCPVNPAWAISQIKMYGPSTDPNKKLGQLSRCIEILKDAGYEPIIEKEDMNRTE